MRNWNNSEDKEKPEMITIFTLPMRNWNSPVFCLAPLSHFKFLPYLWGIETERNYQTRSYWTQFLPYLWGIETFINTFYFFVCFLFLPYLWGIETELSWHNSFNKTWFLPYLWGIETGVPFHSKKERCLNFYPTYEELKLIEVFFICLVFLYFYPTYEELKHI